MRPLDWRGRAVFCMASGPSLTPEDCDLVRASGHPTVVTNTTFRLCPWADALFGFDPPWWNQHIAEVRETFRGRLFTQSLHPRKGVECARQNVHFRSFSMAGTDAIALAIAAGSRRVIILGYDCGLTGGRSHHHGDHPDGLRNCDTLPQWPGRFARLAAWSARRGALVLNASRVTVLECFPLTSLDDALRLP